MRWEKSTSFIDRGSYYYFSIMKSGTMWHYWFGDRQHRSNTAALLCRLPDIAEAATVAGRKRILIWLRSPSAANGTGCNPGLWCGDSKGPGADAEKLGYVKVADLVETLAFHIHMLEG